MNFIPQFFKRYNPHAADISEKGGEAYSGDDPTLAQQPSPEESPFPPRRAFSNIAAPSFTVDHGTHTLYNKEEDRHDALVATIGASASRVLTAPLKIVSYLHGA